MESVPEKKRKATMGRICRKGLREDREKWRKYTSMVRPTLGSRTAKEQNRTSYYNVRHIFVPYEAITACMADRPTQGGVSGVGGGLG